MRWSYEDSKTLSEILKNLSGVLISVGIIIGGIVSWLAFSPFLEAKKHLTELEKLVAETQKVQREAKEKRLLNISLSARQLTDADGKVTGVPRYVVVNAAIRNDGNKDLRFGSSDIFAHLSLIKDVQDGGDIEYAERRSLKMESDGALELSELLIPPGAVQDIRSIQLVKDAGPYLVRFSLALSGSKDVQDQNRAFASTAYVLVK